MSDIKPCPFCGSTMIRFDKCTRRARCGKCFASGGLITPFINQGMSEDEAMREAWNMRVADGKDQ